MWIVRKAVVKEPKRLQWYWYVAAGISAYIGTVHAIVPELEKSRTSKQTKETSSK
jgi:hypothetical protein